MTLTLFSYKTLTFLTEKQKRLRLTALLQFCDASGISMQKVMGFGSDGAAVMIGRRSSVSTRLRVHNPFMINIHCVAHRLALAAAQASELIPYLKKFKNTIHSLYLFITTAPSACLASMQSKMFSVTQKST